MARPLRIEYPGAVHQVTSCGNEKKPVFRDDTGRHNFPNTLQRVNKRYNRICHARCFTTNQYHLLIETPDGNRALGMRRLNGIYPQLFTRPLINSDPEPVPAIYSRTLMEKEARAAVKGWRGG